MKRFTIVLFYFLIALLVLFVYLYVQPRWNYEQTHPAARPAVHAVPA